MKTKQNQIGVDVETEKLYRKAEPVNYETFHQDAHYEICPGESLSSFYEKSLADFYGVCKHQSEAGYLLYQYHVANGNRFATYYRGDALLHIYWIECESELNVVSSNTGGASLPFTGAIPDKRRKPSVTQLKSERNNGMGYVVQLSDGSFILYDGGYRNHAENLWNLLVELNGSEKGIVIRAWIITHAHKDHYPCFGCFSENYASRVRLETFMMSPIHAEEATDTYLNEKVFDDVKRFENAGILYVHTGMLFRYGEVGLEILFTADELYIAESPTVSGTTGSPINFNETSVVSRIFTPECSCLFLGDAFSKVAYRMIAYYGKDLRSNMCQMSHHGLEEFPLLAYRYIKAATLFYPCSRTTYTREGKESLRFENVRKALRESRYTKEILIHSEANETRFLE